MRRFRHFACIDWSGASGRRHRGIAVAACARGGDAPALVAPPTERHWSRTDVLDWLLTQARTGADLLVGVDFSAALPFDPAGGYLPGCADLAATAKPLWAEIDARCRDDADLGCTGFVADPLVAAHFRVGAVTGPRFAGGDRNGRLRVVERQPASGAPASSFNLVGARQVGRASLTGMRMLHRLAGRVPVWPFDPVPPDGPVVIEIYTGIAAVAAGRPRNATKMRRWEALDDALGRPEIGSAPTGRAGLVEDHASDALITAAWLRRAADRPHLWRPALLRADPLLAAREGWTFGVP